MHHSLLTLNHEVGLEMNLALRSRTNTHTSVRVRTHSIPLYICIYLCVSKWESGAQWHSRSS